MTNRLFTLLPLIAVMTLSGCISPQLAHDTSKHIDRETKNIDATAQKMIAQTDNSDAEQRKRAFVNHPYLVGKSIALSPQDTLPLPLQQGVQVKLVFPSRRVVLPVAAEYITLATKIPVVISSDVYLPQNALLPRNQKLEASSASGSPTSALPASFSSTGRFSSGPLPALGDVASSGLATSGYSGGSDIPEVEVTQDQMPLNQVLDLVATRLGVNWKYDAQKGVINIYRMVTKTWLLPITPASMNYSTQDVNNTSQTNNQNAIQNTSTQDKAAAGSEAKNLNEMGSILNDVQTVMTRSGSISGNAAQGTLTITDTRDAVDRAQQIINFHKALLSKMVQLHMRLVQVTLSNQGQLGVDWQAVLSKAMKGVPGFVIDAASPTSLVGDTAGTVTGNITSGAFSGTTAAVNALSDIGNTVSSDDIPLQIQNRHTLWYNNRVRFSYISNTTPATATSGGTGGVPGITTSQDQVGLKLMVYASVTDNNAVVVTVSLDSSVLNSITPITSGSGSNQQTVQLVDTSGQGVTNDAIIRNGGTTVLTVFDSNSSEYDKRRLGHNMSLAAGGSDNIQKKRTAMLLVMSATIKDIGSGQEPSL